MASFEFGIRHFAGQVWYNVDSFLEKNKDTLRPDVINLLIGSKMPMISGMFARHKAQLDAFKSSSQRQDGRFVTMKPRAPTVSARFQESLTQLLDRVGGCSSPLFVRCMKANDEKRPLHFDQRVVKEQLAYAGVWSTVQIRRLGYPVRHRYPVFLSR